MTVFQVEGFDKRLMIHGHNFLKWSERTGKHVQNRADNLTSVHYRIAMPDMAAGNNMTRTLADFFEIAWRKRGSEALQIHTAPPQLISFWEGGPERGNYATLLTLFCLLC